MAVAQSKVELGLRRAFKDGELDEYAVEIRKRAERRRIDGGDAEETTKQPVFFCYGLP